MPKRFGFTLVEILVVITIIGILSAVGLTAYKGVQDRARDAKKRQDIDAIATAYELNYNRKDKKYQALTKDNISEEVLKSPDYCCLLPSGGTAPYFAVGARLSNDSIHCRRSIHGDPPDCRIPTQAGQKPSPCTPFGDVNGDTWVSKEDASKVFEFDLTCSQKQKADVNADNVVDSLDSLSISRYVNGQSNTFTVCSKGSMINCP